MADARRTRTIALVAAGIVLALLLGIGAGWLIRGPKMIDDLEDRISQLEGTEDDADSEEASETVEGEDTDEPADTDEAAETADATAEEEAPVSEETVPTGPTERQPGLVLGVTDSGGTYVMSIDYVQFLTGGEAADAAAAHGDESPPPNDYYVVNDNPRIREFPIQAGIPVSVVTNNDGTSDADGHTITLAQWVAALSGPEAQAFKASLYWVTITNGVVTGIEAQYVP